MPKVSIVIRTKNEERWIGHCLTMVFKQDYKDFEVIVVDNCSVDQTIDIVNRFPVAKTIQVEQFRPGHAINEGVRAASGEYIVCLSAHCVPKSINWLSSFLDNFKSNPKLAGVYGRQLPVSFTDPLDKRDLLIVFGQDRRTQIKDYFFHNANSMFRHDVWKQIPFDEDVTNIEDRVWGKEVIGQGYQLVYDPEPSVYHYHGLHQGNNKERAQGVVSIIEKVDKEVVSDLPDSFKPENANVIAIVPVKGSIELDTQAYNLLSKTVDNLITSRYVNNVYLISSQSELCVNGAKWLNRGLINNADSIGIDELLQQALRMIELGGDYPELVVYANYEYLSYPKGLHDELIVDAQYKGYDTVFASYVDYGHYWFHDDTNQFKQTDSSMKNRSKRDPVYRALYGLGTVSAATVIRSGKLVGERVGMLPLEDLKYTLRLRDIESSFFNGFTEPVSER